MISGISQQPALLRLPRQLINNNQQAGTGPFECISRKFEEIRAAKSACTEKILTRTFQVISMPIIWGNRALKATYLLSFVKPFADFLIIVQPLLSTIVSRMLLVCGAVYILSLIRYSSLIVLQNEFRENLHSFTDSSVFSNPFGSVFEKLTSLQSHVKKILTSETEHHYTVLALEKLQILLKTTSVYDMSIELQIQKVRQAILLDALIYLKGYDQSLENRITSWMDDQLHLELDLLISGLLSDNVYAQNYAEVRAQQLFAQVDKESQKILISHLIGTLTVLCTIIGTIAAIGGAPYLVPLILYALSYMFMGVEYGVFYGCSKKEGWAFDIKDCIPESIRKRSPHIELHLDLALKQLFHDLHMTWIHLSSKAHLTKV